MLFYDRAALPLSRKTLAFVTLIIRRHRKHPVGVGCAARLGARQEGGGIWGVLAELEAAGLVTLADKGYQGSAWAKIPYRGKVKPESQKQANKAHANFAHPGEGRRMRAVSAEWTASHTVAGQH